MSENLSENKKKRNPFVSFIKFICILLAIVIVIAGGYVAYVVLGGGRIEDNLALTPEQLSEKAAVAGAEYKILTLNVGYGSNDKGFSFFMDGGELAYAENRETTLQNIYSLSDLTKKHLPDFLLLQEVDREGSTRSYGIDQLALFKEAYTDYSCVFAFNYVTRFLLYPLNQPIGKIRGGMATLSAFTVDSAVRRSLPIDESGLNKYISLDRCYTVSRVPVENGKSLCLFNVHLSAYESDEALLDKQLELLFGDMSVEYAAGNYVICGGDFNRDFTGDSLEKLNQEYTMMSWTHPLPAELIPDGFTRCLQTSGELVATARNTDTPFVAGETLEVVVDGFIASDNVTCVKLENINAGHSYSDHNPVVMTFTLQ